VPLDNYEVISPVEYKATGHDKKYTIFVPPNLDSSDWVLDGQIAPAGFYAAWESQSGKVEYSRFGTYEVSYIISISSAVAIAVIYLILWKKEFLWKKTGRIVRRLFRFGRSS